MNPIAPAPQSCDECGKTVAKIWRVHKDRKYCATCYARVFKRRMCPKCGNFARLPKNDPDAICQHCQVNKPCVRCGKTDLPVGKITQYGPVCNSCAPHFRTAEPCENCGKPSNRLSRVLRLGHDRRICPSCARADYATCEACRHHRLLDKSKDGRMLCKMCLENGEVPCPLCSRPMPAGRGKQCESCYWHGLLQKRVMIDCATFSTANMTDHFKAFGEWLGNDIGHHKAAITLHRYLPFFLDIEKQWQAIPEYLVLLKQFGALRLRRAFLPMRWMQEAGLVMTDSVAKAEDTELRRISAILDKIGKGTRERTIIDGYHDSLMAELSIKETTLRSIRLAMTPAAALILKGQVLGILPPNQKVLDAYLSETPGSRAAVSGFVCYLREKYGAQIVLPKMNARKVLLNRKRKLEAEMLALMREGGDGDEFRRRWLSVALAYFHGLPKKIGKTVSNMDMLNTGDGGVTVIWDSREYWVPMTIS